MFLNNVKVIKKEVGKHQRLPLSYGPSCYNSNNDFMDLENKLNSKTTNLLIICSLEKKYSFEPGFMRKNKK